LSKDNQIRLLTVKKVCFLLVLCLFIILIAEAASRVVFNVEDVYFIDSNGNRQAFLIPDEELTVRIKENLDGKLISPEYKISLRTNSLGFRADNEFFSEHGNGKFRIMGLGNGFTLGVGVERDQVYLERLAKIIEDSLKMPIEVINLAVLGYGTLQEFRLFEKFKHLSPDLLVIGFFARNYFSSAGGNDLEANYFYANINLQRKGETILIKRQLSPLRKLRYFLKEHLNLYRIFELFFGNSLRQIFKPSDDQFLKEEAWQITSEALLEFDKHLENLGITGIILWIPFVDVLTNNDHSIATKINSLGLKNFIFIDIVNQLKNNIKKCYYGADGHWTNLAHDIAAKSIYKELISADLIDY